MTKESILNILQGQELLDKLNSGEVSILEELGAFKMKNEMKPIGFFCKTMLRLGLVGVPEKNYRKRASKVLDQIAPTIEEGEFPDVNEAIVIGFNHPSLGEILRLISLGFKSYQDREFLFPVNLPWYESIVPVIPKLKKLGIRISPMITPSTDRKLKELLKNDPEKLEQESSIKNSFERRYMKLAKNMAEEKAIIYVAPSATRQAEVISDHIHPTMTILAHMILRGGKTKCSFLPVTIVEPKKNNRRLNLFKDYIIHVCEIFNTDEVVDLTGRHSRDFDYVFLKRIEDVYKEKKQEKN